MNNHGGVTWELSFNGGGGKGLGGGNRQTRFGGGQGWVANSFEGGREATAKGGKT